MATSKSKKTIVKAKKRETVSNVKKPLPVQEVKLPREKEVVFSQDKTRIQTAEGWLRSQLRKHS
jgi:hypothetical protein